MSILREVFSCPLLEEDPPVLVDVGGAGGVYPAWRSLSKFSVCVVIDPNPQARDEIEGMRKLFRRAILVERAVCERGDRYKRDFYQTRSRYCSSLLAPDAAGCVDWEVGSLFDVEKIEEIEVETLGQLIVNAGLERIDWLKVDSQGTDLRIYASLSEQIKALIQAVDLEPGIANFYMGEDKLWDAMKVMHEDGFWLSQMQLGTARRFPSGQWNSLAWLDRRIAAINLRRSPGWAELSYLRIPHADMDKRRLLINCAFAWAQRQYGACLRSAQVGLQVTGDAIFEMILEAAARKIREFEPSTIVEAGSRVMCRLLSFVRRCVHLSP